MPPTTTAALGSRPSSSAAAPGQGALTFSSVAGRTVVRRAWSTSPLKVLNPQNHGSAAWVYLASYGGGLVGGDSLHLEIDVEARAMAVISTQASTKVYRSPRGASQHLRASVADDALLVLAPDPVVCFAASSYTQEQEIHLAPRAALVLIDWLSAGRVASGERWQLDAYTTRTRIWCGDRRLLHESLRLTPREGALGDRMRRFNTLLFAVVAGVALAPHASAILQDISAMPLQTRSDLLISASPVGDTAILLRMAGVSTEAVAQALRRTLNFLSPLLGDNLWARKW